MNRNTNPAAKSGGVEEARMPDAVCCVQWGSFGDHLVGSLRSALKAEIRCVVKLATKIDGHMSQF